MANEQNNIGFYMQRARWDVNKSQEYMATEMCVARKTIQNLERGLSTPSLDQFKEWFKVLRLNPMPYLYVYFYKDEINKETLEDKEVRSLLINIIKDIPIDSIRKFLYIVDGSHGSSAKALLQMMVAHIQTPMQDRYHQASSIYCNYMLAKDMGKLTDVNSVQPDIYFLKRAILKGRNAVITGDDEYSML